ncbi:ImmA/IrrE family metallo-endopeptidase [Pandoraea terrigena]|uniref:ImmA/IrrE family metallo-endopeptidase n=1 Tax=Pandoraea terrigena TaxID=2508292 RepID=UPI0012430E5A|nr:hypothetical protein [Pandoraea terrigena]
MSSENTAAVSEATDETLCAETAKSGDELPGNALVFHEADGVSIIANGNLPWALNRFVKLHELGHLATNTLRASPTQTPSNKTSERQANLWALNQLRRWLKPAALDGYVRSTAACSIPRRSRFSG